MTKGIRPSRDFQKNIKFLDNPTITKIRRLFCIYEQIPLTHIPLLYYKHYQQNLDYADWDMYDLEQLMCKLSGMLTKLDPRAPTHLQTYCLKPRSDPLETSLPTRIKKSIYRSKSILRNAVMSQLFNPELPLWHDFKHLLEMDRARIHIDLSPFEIVLLKDETRTKQHIERFHGILSQMPKGVRQDELCRLFEDIDKSFDLFGSPDVCSITQEYFELFHVRQIGNMPYVFDGRTTTDENLNVKSSDSQSLTAKSILSGLYQKTLLLLSITDLDGMKLGVWHGSVASNFGDYDPVVQPLNLLKAWRDEGLINIKVGKFYLNDLMIDFPGKDIHAKYTAATREQLLQMAGE